MVLKRAFSTGSIGYELNVEANSNENDMLQSDFSAPESSLNSPSFIIKLFAIIWLSFVWGMPCMSPVGSRLNFKIRMTRNNLRTYLSVVSHGQVIESRTTATDPVMKLVFAQILC